MKNYFYTCEIHQSICKFFTTKININQFKKIELKSSYYMSENNCIKAIISDLEHKQKFLEHKLKIYVPSISAANPIIYNGIKEEDLPEYIKGFWPLAKLGIFCLIDETNEEYFIRYSLYEEDDGIEFPKNISLDQNNFYNLNSTIH